MISKLAGLLGYLDALDGRPTLEELTKQLRRLDISCDDLAGFVRFNERQYQRNLVRAGRWYHLWVLCWKNGQRSPIHDHAGSACGVRVLRGIATVTRFEQTPNGHVKAVASDDFPAGSVLANQDHDVHQVSNLQPGNDDLVTLHVYSPPLLRMATFSIMDRSRGEEVWIEERKMVTSFPENSETPLDTVHGWVTPNRLFFVRNHFPVPQIDLPSWKLRIEGCVDRPMELSWEQLCSLQQHSVFATVECAGNGRSFLHEQQPGVQWGAGAIGHAEWTGVPVADVLKAAGVRPGAVEVLFEGGDAGSEADHPEEMRFARSLPLTKALDRDTLLAMRMNGELLAPSHGQPVRLFVPGWYGVASVKWLQRIEVLDRPYHGYFQSVKYTVQHHNETGQLDTVVIGPMAIKAEIIRPAEGAVLGIGTNRVFGVAWAGEESVSSVEVSTDGGSSWAQANILGTPARYCWSLWEYLWEVAGLGDYVLFARATSASGQVQPVSHNPLHGAYLIHHSRARAVRITSGQVVQASHSDLTDVLYDMNAYAEENTRLPLDVELEFSGGAGI